MSRGYSRIHNRKLSTASHASIQFDKLLNENSNRPTASKSSGTLGKWGVISCTSLRSTNPKSRREELLSVKKKRADYSSRAAKLATPLEDPFSFDVDPGSVQGKLAAATAAASPVKPVIKPKKFFKSRNAADPAAAAAAAPEFPGSNRSGATYGGKKYAKEAAPVAEVPAAAASKKFFTSKKAAAAAAAAAAESAAFEQVEAMNLSSPTKSPSPSATEHKPPIVLRIFKGTSHLVGDETDKKTLPTTTHAGGTRQSSSAADGNSNSVIVRSTRSTRSNKNYSEIDDDDTTHLTSSYETRKSTSMSPSSIITELPKKSRRTKSSSSSYEDIVRLATDTSASSTDNRESVSAKKSSRSTAKLEAVQEEIANVTVGENIQDTLTSSQDNFATSQDTGNGSLPTTLDTSSANIEDSPLFSSQTKTEEKDPNENADDAAAEDEVKLLQANELLASTYVDFNTAAEKLLMPQVKCTPEASVAPAKTEWFSDSEDSSSMNDQLPTASTSANDLATSKADLEVAMKLDVRQSSTDVVVTATAAVERRNSPATKKGSIFKSRSLLSGGNKKRLALYKHKWSDNDKPPGGGGGGGQVAQPGSSQPPGELDAEFVTTKLTRVTSWPMTEADTMDLDEAEAITSVKCTKKAKGFYTVVRNVQKAHQIQESGEFQEFNDDVEYILDALQDTYPIGTRCLSAITLASKCMAPAFRMHVRAHGTVAKFFRALHDATKDQSLGLCTATVMFVLSQDRLNMDLDRHSLELMLNLLESDASHRNALDDCGLTDRQLHKNRQKVRELCAEIQSQGHAKHLNLDNITVGHLAMETLLSLTSRRAGEWFKEELRELGGLEHIVNTVCECCRQVDDYVVEWTDPLLDKLRKVDRCLRVLENVTYQNEENQLYLLRYNDGVLLDTLVKLFRQCDSEMPLYPVTDPLDKDSTGTVIREVLLATLKVLINLTHDFNNKSFGSALAGERKGIIDASLHLLLQVADYVPEEKKFDMLVLALIMLINLVEHCQPNRKLLFEAKAPPDPENVFHSNDKSAVQALIALFHQQEEHARSEEMKTDAILDGKKDTDQPEAAAEKPKTQEEFIEETVAKLLQKAGRNMEHTLISAYVGLLLGFLIIDNHGFEVAVRQALPDQQFATMIAVLQKVFNFMNLTASAGGMARGIAQMERVINFMTKSDKLAAELNDPSSATNKDESMDDSFS